MIFPEVLQQNPMILVVVLPTVLGAVTFIGFVVLDQRQSQLKFWHYLAEADLAYPIKPNSRLMYAKLRSVSDAHDHANRQLNEVASELQAIHVKLQEMSKRNPELSEVQEDVAGVLGRLQPESNVTPFRARG